MSWYKIAEIENIPEMGARVIEFGELELAIFKTKDGEIFAINNICPHKQGKLNDGLVHGHVVTCPLHNTDINLENGSAISENYECSKTYETKIKNQLIYIQIP